MKILSLVALASILTSGSARGADFGRSQVAGILRCHE